MQVSIWAAADLNGARVRWRKMASGEELVVELRNGQAVWLTQEEVDALRAMLMDLPPVENAD